MGYSFEITDKVSLFFIPVFKSHGPNSAGSVSGDVVAIVTGVVGSGIRTIVTDVGTGALFVQPATSNPSNKTAQTKNSKDFISHCISTGH